MSRSHELNHHYKACQVSSRPWAILQKGKVSIKEYGPSERTCNWHQQVRAWGQEGA